MLETGQAGKAGVPWIAPALLVLLCFFAYANSFEAQFALDSETLVLQDARIREFSLPNVEAILKLPYWPVSVDVFLYRPLVTFSYLANYALLGDENRPWGYHFVNFALHTANSLLVWGLALLIFRHPLPAFFSAALFSVHPVATEAVTNIAGRPDLMAAAAVLGGLLLYTRGPVTEGWRRTLAECGLFLIALAGILSKENAVVLVPAMFLLDLTLRPEIFRKFPLANGRLYVAAGTGAILGLYLRYLVLSAQRAPNVPFVDNPIQGAGFIDGRLTALSVILREFKQLTWPQVLSCDYSYNQIGIVGRWEGLAALAGVLVLFSAVLLCYRLGRSGFFFGMLFFLALFPVSNLLLIIGSIRAERFLYLPLAGFAGCVAGAVYGAMNLLFSGRKRAGYATATVLAAIALLCGVRTVLRNRDWKDTITLWSTAMEASPNSFKPYFVVGAQLAHSGQPGSIDRAIELEQKAVSMIGSLSPQQSTTLPYSNLGISLLARGAELESTSVAARLTYEQAVMVFMQAVPIDEAFNAAQHRNYRARGWPPERIPDLGNEQLWRYLGDALFHLGRLPEALDAKQHALRLSPSDYGVLHERSEILLAMGRLDEAAQAAAQSALMSKRPEDLAQFATIYAQLNPRGCPATAGFPEKLNLACGAVRSIVCPAEQALLQSFQEAHAPELIPIYRRLENSTAAVCPSRLR
jgi:protein O-mannosyl-transferase